VEDYPLFFGHSASTVAKAGYRFEFIDLIFRCKDAVSIFNQPIGKQKRGQQQVGNLSAEQKSHRNQSAIPPNPTETDLFPPFYAVSRRKENPFHAPNQKCNQRQRQQKTRGYSQKIATDNTKRNKQPPKLAAKQPKNRKKPA
jgi:hypothetical protein